MTIVGVNFPNLGIAFRFQSSYNFVIKQMSKYVDNSIKLKYDGIRTYVRIGVDGGGIIMTENEMELINMIREADNPGQALMTAGVIIIGFLKQLESSVAQESVVLQELA